MTSLRAKWNRYSAGGDLRRFADKVPDRLTRDLGRHFPWVFYGRRISQGVDSARLLRGMLDSRTPVAVGRLGATEQRVLWFYQKNRAHADHATPYPENIRNDISVLSGVNPPTEEVLDRFAQLYIDSLRSLDVLGAWFHRTERSLVREILPKTSRLVQLVDLDPLTEDDPWSSGLRGKRVCVVHPFKKSIETQYRRRSEVLDDRYLPEFDLTVVEAVQALGGLPVQYESWFDALDQMSSQVADAKPDVVLIGAGAFGLPLAARAKSSGISALHLGGSLQLLFGIMGSRWETKAYLQRHVTGSWVRPDRSEIPIVADQVENRCYW